MLLLLLLQPILHQLAGVVALSAVSSSASTSISSPRNLELWTNDFTFAQAQARAVCLHTYVDELMAQSSVDKASNAAIELSKLLQKPPRLLESCTRNVNCRGCLAATWFHPRLAVCQRDCKDSVYCEQSCKRLRSIASNRPGACPAVTDPRAVACSSACNSDTDCVFADGYKCCDTGLCRACRPPAPSRRGADPSLPRPSKPSLINSGRGDGSLLLTWPTLTTVENSTTEQQLKEPVVYAVQARYMVGRRFESSRASGWQNVSLVVGEGVAVEEVRSGHIYQFRVAAVTRLGTRGFGPASAPYSSGAPPQAPGAPSSLSEGRLRIYSSGRVSVQVHWESPSEHELPVHLYQIRWAKDHGFVNSDGSVLSVTRFSNSRPGNARSYLIENLEPGTSYKVEVRAASLWGDETLLGPPNSIYVSTPQPSHRPNQPGDPNSPASSNNKNQMDEACSSTASASSYVVGKAEQPHLSPAESSTASATPLHIQQPIYENRQLTVRMLILGVSVGSEETLYRVQWRRRVCIDTPGNGKLFQMSVVAQHGYFQLTQLQFNCRYFVRLTPMDSAASRYHLRNITACFRTPSCDEVKLASGSLAPERCPAALETLLPEPPGRIQVRQLSTASPSRPPTGAGNNQLLSYLVTWSPATTAASSDSSRHRRGRGPSISGYCIVWGPRLDEPVSQSSYLPAVRGAAATADASSGGVEGSLGSGLYPQMDTERAVTRVLGPANTSLVIRGLHPGKLYIVQVHSQAFSNGQLLVSRSSSYFLPPRRVRERRMTEAAGAATLAVSSCKAVGAKSASTFE